jgi:MFS transporter, PPP family, 3-phenylpropionic acid transporter
MRFTNLNFKLSILQGTYWAASCVLFSFMVPLLKGWNYSNFTIGTMTMLIALSCMTAQPLWGMYCDHKGTIKGVFITNVSISCGLVLFLPLASKSLLLACILLIMLSSTIQSMGSIIDAWTIRLYNDGEKVNYSLTRSFGALVYAFTAAGFGSLLDRYGMWIRIPVFIGLTILIILVAFKTKAPALMNRYQVESKMTDVVKKLKNNRRYMRFLTSIVLIFIGYGATQSFYPILLNQLGGTNTDLGLGLFIMALSQVPPMLFYVFLVKKIARGQTLLMFSMFFFSLKGVVLALSANIPWALGGQLFEILSFGLFLPAAVGYINEIVEQKNIVTAQLVFSASTFGLGSIIGNFSGGLLSEFFGVRNMMLLLNSVGFMGFLYFVFTEIKNYKLQKGSDYTINE